MREGWPGPGVCPASGEGASGGATPLLWLTPVSGCQVLLATLPARVRLSFCSSQGPRPPGLGCQESPLALSCQGGMPGEPAGTSGRGVLVPHISPAIWAEPVFVEPGSRTVTMDGNNSSCNPSELDRLCCLQGTSTPVTSPDSHRHPVRQAQPDLQPQPGVTSQ